jgi:hypothetical protein
LFSKYYISTPNVFTTIASLLLELLPQLRLVTLSIIASTILMISSSLFALGFVCDSKGSGGGDNSAAIQNMNKLEVTRIKHKVKSN